MGEIRVIAGFGIRPRAELGGKLLWGALQV